MPKIHAFKKEDPRCTKGFSFSKNWNFEKFRKQNFAFFLTGKLHFINIHKLQFLKTSTDDAKELCLRGKVVKMYQRTNFGLTIACLLGQVGQLFN